MVMFLIEVVNRTKRQKCEINERKESDGPWVDLVFSLGEFPVSDFGVNRPECRVLLLILRLNELSYEVESELSLI